MVIQLHDPISTETFGETILLSNFSDISILSKDESDYLKKKLEKGSMAYVKGAASFWIAIKASSGEKEFLASLEKIRQAASEAFDLVSKEELPEMFVYDGSERKEALVAFIEGFLLSNYSFQKYKSEKAVGKLEKVHLHGLLTKGELGEIQQVVEAVHTARNWVNEPLITFTAEDFGREAEALGKAKGFKVTVFDKKKIEKLKMGGLLAINAGSLNPPTFIIGEYKPSKPVNKKPIVLIGKGVVYDTGGLSLKPTPNSMDYMKCDMAGGAAVLATLAAIAENKLPVHIIALVPATENRLDGNAITPGDVITMLSGQTVEVMNTDAEGRIILADALTFAKQYDPELVIDVATLTGSAVMSIGNKGIVYMGTASKEVKESLEATSFEVFERLVEFPLWEEYGKYLDSDIADMKNLGGADSGAIVAGKFLERYVSYPWLHLDIAAMAYLHQKESYKGKGGTGVGVRLLYQFIKKYSLANG